MLMSESWSYINLSQDEEEYKKSWKGELVVFVSLYSVKIQRKPLFVEWMQIMQSAPLLPQIILYVPFLDVHKILVMLNRNFIYLTL